MDWFRQHATQVEAVLHIGARTNTTEQDLALLDRLNLSYSIQIWKICTTHQIPLVYASSAATYGNGEHGYSDDHALIPSLKPMNPYGQSKQDFDLWALAQEKTPPFWAGLKFFNVYGPNEYHKGRMASVVMHTFNQIQATGTMSLFKSHRADVADGYQSRDFVYVKDVVNVIVFLLEQQPNSAIYNLGSGEANPFFDLARFTFEAMGKEAQISFIDTPIDIRETYQYYTCAGMSKLRESGYTKAFYTLKEGVFDYVQQYLLPHAYY
jgi:ADP-L-glycero-D-manno-heptose 6-epimerase